MESCLGEKRGSQPIDIFTETNLYLRRTPWVFVSLFLFFFASVLYCTDKVVHTEFIIQVYLHFGFGDHLWVSGKGEIQSRDNFMVHLKPH